METAWFQPGDFEIRQLTTDILAHQIRAPTASTPTLYSATAVPNLPNQQCAC